MSGGLLMHIRANPVLGTGRMLRSLTLARQWVSDGGHVTFVTSDIPGLLLRKIAFAGCKARFVSTQVGDSAFAKRLCELAEEDQCDWIVTDDTSADLVSNIAAQRTSRQQHVVLGRRRLHDVDLSTEDDPSTALIRRNLLLSPPRRPDRKKRPPRCLVDLTGMSGEESSGLLLAIIKRFTGTGVVFDVVTPFAASAAEQLLQQKASIRDYIYWHRNPDRVFQALYAFDVGVMSEMAEFYEAAYSRIACLLVADQPFDGAARFADLTTLPWILSRKSDNWIGKTCDRMEQLLSGRTRCRRHASEMERLVDDQGAARLCSTLRKGLGQLGKVRSA